MDDDAPSTSGSGGSSIPDALPYLGSDSDWREFRAKLVSQSRGEAGSSPDSGEWAHAIPKPERGALLLAHPMMFANSQRYFHRAVILLLEHGDRGSYGVILNRPSSVYMRDLDLGRPLPEFDDCRLYLGGDVGDKEVLLVHPHGELKGATEVVKGLYLGGVEAARAAIATGRAQPADFRWSKGYAGWAAGQLQSECKRGVWFTAAASPKVVLREVGLADGSEYWHKILGLMGGDYADISEAVKSHDKLMEGGGSGSERSE